MINIGDVSISKKYRYFDNFVIRILVFVLLSIGPNLIFSYVYFYTANNFLLTVLKLYGFGLFLPLMNIFIWMIVDFKTKVVVHKSGGGYFLALFKLVGPLEVAYKQIDLKKRNIQLEVFDSCWFLSKLCIKKQMPDLHLGNLSRVVRYTLSYTDESRAVGIKSVINGKLDNVNKITEFR